MSTSSLGAPSRSDAREGEGTEDGHALRPGLTELCAELARRDRQVERLQLAVEGYRRELAEIQASRGWRALRGGRAARDRLVARVPVLRALHEVGLRLLRRTWRGSRAAPPSPPGPGDPPAVRDRAARLVPGLALSGFTIVIVAGDRPDRDLASCTASAAAQRWDRLEVRVVGGRDDASPAGSPADALRIERVDADGVAAATTGAWVIFLEPGEELAPNALLLLASQLQAEPDADVVYSDEAARDPGTGLEAPFLKPDWSPELLLSADYVSRLAAYRRTLLDAVGWPDPGRIGWRYALALRATARARSVAHVAEVLVRGAPRGLAAPSDVEALALAERRAVEEALHARGVEASVEQVEGRPRRVRYALRGAPLVSIIMPTRDGVALLRRCVETLDARSTWGRRELLIVDNGSRRPEMLRYLASIGARHRVLRDARPFNWSALNNAAARAAAGDALLFMNDDMEVVSPGWIEALLEHAQRDGVGAAGAKLLYPDGTLQHAGLVVGEPVARSAFRGLPDHAFGHHQLHHATREVSAVTGACMMVRRQVFERLGGFDEALPVAYNDVDFCLRLRRAGLRTVYTPHAVLVHRESATRGSLHPPADEALLRSRWAAELADDPFHGLRLTPEVELRTRDVRHPEAGTPA